MSARLGALLLTLGLLGLFSSAELASAQRVRTTPPPPVTFSIAPAGDGHRLVVALEARERVEISADRRWLRAELRDVRGRRLSCASPVRPRVGSRARTLEAGERWAEWLDVRELCWGRALDALPAARELTFHFDAGRAPGAWVARTPTGSVRALQPVVSAWRAPASTAPEPESMLRVRLAPTDTTIGGRPTLRVSVAGASHATVRAYVRPENVSFHVVAPSGRGFECGVPAFEGRPLPDFFRRLSLSRPAMLSLDGQAYCGRLEEPGIYEVTPIVTLRERGAEWRLAGVTGVFRGVGAPIRVRSSTYVEQPWSGR